VSYEEKAKHVYIAKWRMEDGSQHVGNKVPNPIGKGSLGIA
jgi:hypothetical protein